MSNSNTLNMTQCPYCHVEWVQEDTELVCKACEPYMNSDLAIGDLVSAIAILKQSNINTIKNKKEMIGLLISSYQSLGEIVQKIKSQ
jgi:hypothetical protein